MTEQTTDETTSDTEDAAAAPDPAQDTEDSTATPGEGAEDQGDPETFPRAYVQELRAEAAEHRTRARDRDALAARLHLAQVAATGRLADPEDLPYAEELLEPDALATALDELLARKPHLASRRVAGNIGQGASSAGQGVDLAGLLRARA